MPTPIHPPVGQATSPVTSPQGSPPSAVVEGAPSPSVGRSARSDVVPPSPSAVPEDPLRALKGDLWNALWPTYPGSLYGRAARDPERKAQLDANLRELLDFFGRERLLELSLQYHVEMSRGRTPPRTFLGHLDKLRRRMEYEITLESDDLACGGGAPAPPTTGAPPATNPTPYKPATVSPEQRAMNQQGLAAAREVLSQHRKEDPAAYARADRVRAAEEAEADNAVDPSPS